MRTTPDRLTAANQKLAAEMRRMGVMVWCETYQPLINDMKRTGGVDWR
jgi:hypothetical protein